MQKLTDEEIIYQAYLKYPGCCRKKHVPVLTKGKVITLRAEMMRQVDKFNLFLKSSTTPESEKLVLCRKGKALYQKFCMSMMANRDIGSIGLSQRIEEMMRLIAFVEKERLGRNVLSEKEKESFDLNNFLSETRNIRELMGTDIGELVRKKIDDGDYLIEEKVYVTLTGSKYHKKDCQYCKGKKLESVILAEAKKKKLEPCKCIGSENEVKGEVCIKLFVKEPVRINNEKYVTAFVDESVRINRLKSLDNRIPAKQGIYGYIICDGFLGSELKISKENILYKKVCAADGEITTGKVAIEAILAVLIRLVSIGYSDNVLIFTDNQEAEEFWDISKQARNLIKMFTSVDVKYVPREYNRAADALVRERVFLDLPSDAVKKLFEIISNNKKLTEELEFVREYFPEPRKQIPNLLAELETLANF